MDNIVYSRISENRDRRFTLTTQIIESKKGKSVRKSAVYEEGVTHLQHIQNITPNLLMQYKDSKKIKVLPLTFNEASLEYPFVKDQSFERFLDEQIEMGQFIDAIEHIKLYFDSLKEGLELVPFVKSKEFCEVFGDIQIANGAESLCISNIDAIFSNVFFNGGYFTMIDCEWTFDFLVPLEYIYYRCIFWYQMNGNRIEKLKDINLFKLLCFDERSMKLYACMEDAFQNYVRGNKVPLWKVKDVLPRNTKTLDEFLLDETLTYKDEITIYEDYGQGFSEINSYKAGAFQANGLAHVYFESNPNIKRIRIDPGEKICGLKVHYILAKSISIKDIPYLTNGVALDENNYLFLNDDPQIILSEEIQIGGSIELCISRSVLTSEIVNALIKSNNHANNEITRNQNEVVRLTTEFDIQSNSLHHAIEMKDNELKAKDNHINNLTTMLDNIKNSRWQRLGNKLRRR